MKFTVIKEASGITVTRILEDDSMRFFNLLPVATTAPDQLRDRAFVARQIEFAKWAPANTQHLLILGMYITEQIARASEALSRYRAGK